MNRLIFFFPLIIFSSQAFSLNQQFKRTLKLMGSRFDITVVAPDERIGNDYIDMAVAEITRIEKLISSWDPQSETSLINMNAGNRPVKVSQELFDLIIRANSISRLTDGAFDISYAAMDRVWKFDGAMKTLPNDEDIARSVRFVGYERIQLNTDSMTVFLPEKGMKIGFGAIGKGFAADKARRLLIDKGCVGGIINASGDMNVWGRQTNGEPWKVGITNPLNHDKVFSWFDLVDQAVVTSGDYEKYVEFNGRRYTHIIDPRTGWPSSGLISVTVFAPKAELADALATSIFIMGMDTGIDFVNQLDNIECILIDEHGGIHTSKNIKLESDIK